MKKIVLRIAPGGESKLLVEGCHGPECQSLTEFLDKRLGPPQDEELTSDFYDPPLTNEVQENA